MTLRAWYLLPGGVLDPEQLIQEVIEVPLLVVNDKVKYSIDLLLRCYIGPLIWWFFAYTSGCTTFGRGWRVGLQCRRSGS